MRGLIPMGFGREGATLAKARFRGVANILLPIPALTEGGVW